MSDAQIQEIRHIIKRLQTELKSDVPNDVVLRHILQDGLSALNDNK